MGGPVFRILHLQRAALCAPEMRSEGGGALRPKAKEQHAKGKPLPHPWRIYAGADSDADSDGNGRRPPTATTPARTASSPPSSPAPPLSPSSAVPPFGLDSAVSPRDLHASPGDAAIAAAASSIKAARHA